MKPQSFSLACLLALFAPWLAFSETTGTVVVFDTANKLFAQGRFAEAAGAYEQLIQAGTISPALYFNLGNAQFKSGNIGRAIESYRLAEQISPRDPDTRANLQFARNQVQGPTLRVRAMQHWLGTLSLDEWTWLAAGAFWLLCGLLITSQLCSAWARPLRSWTILSAAATLLLIACALLTLAQNKPGSLAIVTTREASVRNSPFEESPGAFTANDGAELQVLDRKKDSDGRNEWLQVTDGARRVGWVKGGQVVVFPRM